MLGHGLEHLGALDRVAVTFTHGAGEREASLRKLLLSICVLAIWVQELNSLSLRYICEGGLVTCDTLVGEVLENLLKGGLSHTVFLDTKVSLFSLQFAKEPSDSLALLGHAKLEELTALLKHLNLVEVSCQEVQDAEAVSLSMQVLKQVPEANLTVVINLSLNIQVRSETIFPNLAKDKLIKLSLSAFLNGTIQGHLCK